MSGVYPLPKSDLSLATLPIRADKKINRKKKPVFIRKGVRGK